MTKLYMEDSKEHLGRLGQSDREEVLSEIWGAKKKLIDGKWYVELSEVAEIVGGPGKQATPEDMWDYGC